MEIIPISKELELIRGLLAVKEKYHCSWDELLELPIPTVIEMWNAMEKESKEIKKEMDKMKVRKR